MSRNLTSKPKYFAKVCRKSCHKENYWIIACYEDGVYT